MLKIFIIFDSSSQGYESGQVYVLLRKEVGGDSEVD